jgi:hypothetical protein
MTIAYTDSWPPGSTTATPRFTAPRPNRSTGFSACRTLWRVLLPTMDHGPTPCRYSSRCTGCLRVSASNNKPAMLTVKAKTIVTSVPGILVVVVQTYVSTAVWGLLRLTSSSFHALRREIGKRAFHVAALLVFNSLLDCPTCAAALDCSLKRYTLPYCF